MSISGDCQLWSSGSLSNKANMKKRQPKTYAPMNFKLNFIFRSSKNNYFLLQLWTSVIQSYKIKNTYNFLLLPLYFLHFLHYAYCCPDFPICITYLHSTSLGEGFACLNVSIFYGSVCLTELQVIIISGTYRSWMFPWGQCTTDEWMR